MNNSVIAVKVECPKSAIKIGYHHTVYVNENSFGTLFLITVTGICTIGKLIQIN